MRTVRESIAKLPRIQAGTMDFSDNLHQAAGLDPINLKRIKVSVPGGSWRDWPKTLLLNAIRRGLAEHIPVSMGAWSGTPHLRQSPLSSSDLETDALDILSKIARSHCVKGQFFKASQNPTSLSVLVPQSASPAWGGSLAIPCQSNSVRRSVRALSSTQRSMELALP